MLFGIFKYACVPEFTITSKGLALASILALILECISGWKIVGRLCNSLGKMSLEIYLCNIFLSSLFKNAGLGYVIIVCLTIVLAYILIHYLE